MLISSPGFWTSAGVLLIVATALSGAQTKPPSAKPAPSAVAPATTLPAGERIFKSQCASCHGVRGEGAAAYPRPLTGNRSVAELAKYIHASMPPGPKHCSAADSPQVAGYIFDTFYSPLAQERIRPARVTLSHLTVRQMRNAISDLIGSFRGGAPAINENRGLRAEYFKARRFSNEDRVLQRVDPQVAFDFGNMGPSGAEFDPHQFSIRWSGSVVAPDTGLYEIVVQTDHGMRLWLNNGQKPLIDAWVKSGPGTEFRGSIYLVGGRAYPLRLEFSKSTQGVDDTEKKKGKPAPKASITLLWKRPKLPVEPIPGRNLLPDSVPESFVLTTPFPPDDRSMGYERGDSVSKAWDDATTAAALETADYVVEYRRDLCRTDNDVPALKAFCRKFVERAQRHPLDPATEALYINRQFERAPDPLTALKRVVLLTLKSPRFLYREVGASGSDPYDIASRLSFALWDSIPDEWLFDAAASGQLKTRAQIDTQAQRMASDRRAWLKQREFLLQWLRVDQTPDLAKDTKRFPDFSPAVASELRTSLDLTLESVVRSERSDLRELLLSDRVYLNGRLAALYGVSLPPDAPFTAVDLDPGERAGILTHPYVLASFAYIANSSPIHRGVLLTRSVMGRTLAPPPAAFTPLAADLHPSLTTRERVAMQTKPAACIGCHGIINPLGFTLEKFDAIGKLRTLENGKPIDAHGSYTPLSGKTVTFNGAKDLARFVADSPDVHAAFVEKLFQFEVKQPIRAYGPRMRAELVRNFADSGYSIRNLTARIAVESAVPSSSENPKLSANR